MTATSLTSFRVQGCNVDGGGTAWPGDRERIPEREESSAGAAAKHPDVRDLSAGQAVVWVGTVRVGGRLTTPCPVTVPVCPGLFRACRWRRA